jgi:hypothetical protein
MAVDKVAATGTAAVRDDPIQVSYLMLSSRRFHSTMTSG